MAETAENPEFVYAQEAKNILAYLFLKDFHERFSRTIDRISNYLSNYDKYNSYFGTIGREEITQQIKQDLLSVIYILNSINLSPDVRAKVRRLVNGIDDIIRAEILTKEQLKDLLSLLGQVIAISFLKDLVKYVPPLEERMRGDYD